LLLFQLDLGNLQQSLGCNDQSTPCGNTNEGLFTVPDPDFAPLIVLFDEDDDNKTAVVVFGDEQDVKDTNDHRWKEFKPFLGTTLLGLFRSA
jgi:hypothetical protein